MPTVQSNLLSSANHLAVSEPSLHDAGGSSHQQIATGPSNTPQTFSQPSHQLTSTKLVSIPPNRLLVTGAASHSTDSQPPISSPPPTSSLPTLQRNPDSYRRRPSPPPRLISFQKRHASFDSPREVPLPSPSLLASTGSSYFFSPPSIQHPPSEDSQFQSHNRSQTSSTNALTKTEYSGPQSLCHPWSKLQLDTNVGQGPVSLSDRRSVSTDSNPDPYMVFDEDDDRGAVRCNSSDSAATSPEPSPISETNEKGREALASCAPRQGSAFGEEGYDVVCGHSGEMGMQSGDLESSLKGKGKAVDLSPSMVCDSLPANVSNDVDECLESGNRFTATQGWIDRSSSTSLPLPTQVPYRTLPQASRGKEGVLAEQSGEMCSRDNACHSSEQQLLVESQSSTVSGDIASSPPPILPCSQYVPGQLAFSRAALEMPPSFYSPLSAPIASRSFSSPHSYLPHSPSAPTSTPQLLAQTQSHSPRLTHSFWQYTQQLTQTSSSSSSTSSDAGLGYAASSSVASTVSTASSRPSSSSGPCSLPPPQPPVILPIGSTEGDARSTACGNAPYAPFLCRMPPPPDSWIEVETSPSEYKLVARLPGFRRECITLAMKRRRILHIVADSWEQNGGHFERRVSFGYDADLTQVRAEFDGTLLKVSIPRRLPSVSMWDTRRPLG